VRRSEGVGYGKTIFYRKGKVGLQRDRLRLITQLTLGAPKKRRVQRVGRSHLVLGASTADRAIEVLYDESRARSLNVLL